MAIEGIKLQINSAELKTLLQKRVEYHVERAAWNEGKLKTLAPEFKQAEEDAAAEAEGQDKYTSNSNYGSASPLDRFKQNLAHHRNRAVVFRFMADHVIPNETYTLNESDLHRLEVMK